MRGPLSILHGTPRRRRAFDRMRSGAARWSVPALAALGGLAACGGGADGHAPVQPPPETPLIEGVAYASEQGLTDGYAVFLKARTGVARPMRTGAGHQFLGQASETAPPYVVGYRWSPEVGAYMVGAGPQLGRINATPLTTLAMAELLGQDPAAWYDRLGASDNDSLASLDLSQLSDAQARMRRHVRQRWGVTIPPALGDYFSTAFTAAAGDPMFDAIAALNTGLAAQGLDANAAAKLLGAEAALCNAEQLALRRHGDLEDFCPQTKNTQRDDTDVALRLHRFTTSSGATLEVSVRGDVLQSVVLTEPAASGGAVYRCAADGCDGVTLGAVARDGSRTIGFEGTVLRAGRARLSLTGTLQAPKPGPVLPPLPCTTNRYFLVYSEDRVEGSCAAPDSTFGLAYGTAFDGYFGRTGFRFDPDGSTTPPPASLEVRIDDADGRVTSVRVRDLDPATGLLRGDYLCRDSACAGVTIGAPRDDVDTVAPYTLRFRQVTLNGTALTPIDATGAAVAGDPLTVSGAVESLAIIAPADSVQPPLPCASPNQRVIVTGPRSQDRLSVCPPDVWPPPEDPNGGSPVDFISSFRLADGTVHYTIAGALGAAGLSGASAPSNLIRLVMLNGEVQRVAAEAIGFECETAACTGVSVSEPDADGNVTVRFDGTPLTELETARLPGTRQVTLNGRYSVQQPAP